MSRDESPLNWADIRKQVYRRDGYQCQNCGRYGGPYGEQELRAYQVVPDSEGGSHHPSNLLTFCRNCYDRAHGRDTPGSNPRRSRRRTPSSTISSTRPPTDDSSELPLSPWVWITVTILILVVYLAILLF